MKLVQRQQKIFDFRLVTMTSLFCGNQPQFLINNCIEILILGFANREALIWEDGTLEEFSDPV